ncbi:MAG: DUF1289 domain-containing protein [Rhodospirillales bacterium]|nr:DUF1289 domain-containing protein [Rhodospirillales bacterium]
MLRDPERSPCIGICELDTATGLCRGCLRSGDEIAVWPAASRDLRRQILERIDARRDAMQADAALPTSAR